MVIFINFWKKNYKAFIKTGLILLVIGVVLFVVHNFFFSCIIIKDSSMSPSLEKGHVLLVQRNVTPQRYHIVLFSVEDNPVSLKRVVGMPGDKICIQEGKIYIDGEEVEEYYGKEPMYNGGIADKEITLGEDEYFLLGDNRNNSADSRREKIGIVKKSQIKGRAIFRIFPLAGVGSLNNQ